MVIVLMIMILKVVTTKLAIGPANLEMEIKMKMVIIKKKYYDNIGGYDDFQNNEQNGCWSS